MRPKTPRRVSAAGLTRATMFYLGATTAACTGEPTQEPAPAAPSISVEVAPTTAPAQEVPAPEPVAEPEVVAALEPAAPVEEPPPDVSPGPALDPARGRRARPRPSDERTSPAPIHAPATGYGGPPMHDLEVLEDVVRGRVTFRGAEGVSGGDMDAALVTRMIRTRLAAVRACYERALRSDPTLAGRVTIEFTVEPTGAVSSAALQDDTVASPEVAACITQTVRRFRFHPGPEGGAATFRAPFEFATGL